MTLMAVLAVGCAGETTQPTAPPSHTGLASTLVPNTNLDVYVYIKQENPTTVPKDLIGTPSDVVAESLALWGVATEDKFVLGGGLTLVSAADAARIYPLILSQTEFWAKLSDRTIYFVQGSGTPAEALKTVISKNDFKQYDDQQALEEVALFPDGGTTKLVAIGIIKPSKTLVSLMTKNVDPATLGMVNTLLKWASIQVMTAGLYSAQPIDAAEVVRGVERGNIWESDLGILASVKSGLPGFVVSPIIKRFLGNAGYTETQLGELSLHQASWDAGNGTTIHILLRIDGNRIFAAMSGNESYAQTLITSVK